jgi:peptide-methionine (S)-S-oxide reductase
MAEFEAMFSQNIDFVNSTAAARVNGYVGGYGDPEKIAENIESLTLSTAGQKRLLEISKNWRN